MNPSDNAYAPSPSTGPSSVPAAWLDSSGAGASGAQGSNFDLGISKDPLRLSLLLVVLFSISRVHQHFTMIGRLRPALLLFVFCALYVALKPNSVDLRNLRVGPAPKAMAGLAILACLSALFGISLGNSATFFLAEFSRTLTFAFLLVVAIRSVRDLSTFIWGFVLSAGIWIWLGLFFFEPEVDIGSGRENVRLSGLYTYDSNDLGLILMIALPLTLLVFQASRGRFIKAICAATLVGIVMTTALTGSRGAMVGLFAVVGALFLTLTHIALVKRVGLIALIGLALAVAAPAGYWESMRSLADPTDDYNWSSEDGRKEVALRGLGYMAAYPVFGIGLGNFGRAEGTISSKARTHVAGTGIRWTAAHNSYVQVGAELGPMGLGLFLWIIFAGIVGVRRMWNRIPSSWEYGDADRRFLFFSCRYLPVAFVGFAVPAIFVSFAYLTPVYFLAAFMTGFFLLVERKLAEESGAAGAGALAMASGPRAGWRSEAGQNRSFPTSRIARRPVNGMANPRAGRTTGGWRTAPSGAGLSRADPSGAGPFGADPSDADPSGAARPKGRASGRTGGWRSERAPKPTDSPEES